MSNILYAYKDWVVVIVSICLVLILGASGLVVYRHLTKDPTEATTHITYDPYANELYKIIPPDKQFPPFAQTQRSFYRTYTEQAIQYDIEPLVLNMSHNPDLGEDTFLVRLYNSANKVVMPTGSYLAALSIGCVAQDGPYRKIAVETEPLTFGPYEKKELRVSADAGCVYVGDGDGRWFWRVY